MEENNFTYNSTKTLGNKFNQGGKDLYTEHYKPL